MAVVRSQHPTGPAVEPGPEVTASAEPDALDELVDLDAAVRIRRELPEQPPFQVLALGRDGTVLGVPRGGGGDSILGTGVWRAGPAGGVPELVVDTSPELSYSLWAVALGERGYLWPQGEVLACLGPDGEGPVRTFPEGSRASPIRMRMCCRTCGPDYQPCAGSTSAPGRWMSLGGSSRRSWRLPLPEMCSRG